MCGTTNSLMSGLSRDMLGNGWHIDGWNGCNDIHKSLISPQEISIINH